MKLKDWERQSTQMPNDFRGQPIKCPCCGEIIGYEKDYQYMVILYPIACPKCDEIVIYPNNITY